MGESVLNDIHLELMYKLIYKGVPNGILLCIKCYTKMYIMNHSFRRFYNLVYKNLKHDQLEFFFLIDVKFTKWYTLSAYMYKLK